MAIRPLSIQILEAVEARKSSTGESNDAIANTLEMTGTGLSKWMKEESAARRMEPDNLRKVIRAFNLKPQEAWSAYAGVELDIPNLTGKALDVAARFDKLDRGRQATIEDLIDAFTLLDRR